MIHTICRWVPGQSFRTRFFFLNSCVGGLALARALTGLVRPADPMCFQCFVLQSLTKLNTHTRELECKLRNFMQFIFERVKLDLKKAPRAVFSLLKSYSARAWALDENTVTAITHAPALLYCYYDYNYPCTEALCSVFSPRGAAFMKLKRARAVAHTQARELWTNAAQSKPRLQQVSRQQRARSGTARACLLNSHHLTHMRARTYHPRALIWRKMK